MLTINDYQIKKADPVWGHLVDRLNQGFVYAKNTNDSKKMKKNT